MFHIPNTITIYVQNCSVGCELNFRSFIAFVHINNHHNICVILFVHITNEPPHVVEIQKLGHSYKGVQHYRFYLREYSEFCFNYVNSL